MKDLITLGCGCIFIPVGMVVTGIVMLVIMLLVLMVFV